VSTFSSSPIGSGQQHVDIDTHKSDDYWKPFRTRKVRSQVYGGGVKSTDLVQRRAARRRDRGKGLLSVLVLPSVAYGDVYDDLHYVNGEPHEFAHQHALVAARAALSAAGDFDKFFPKAQADFNRLEEDIAMNDPVPTPENQPVHPGASGPRPGGPVKTPGGVGLSGTGTTPNAVASQQRLPRTPDGLDVEHFEFTSANGQSYKFVKKQGGVVHQNYLPLLVALSMAEASLGGDPMAIFSAGGVILTDVDGNQFFPPVAPPEPVAPPVAPLPDGVQVG